MGNSLSKQDGLVLPTLYGLNTIWHFLAAYYFILKGRGIIKINCHYPFNKNNELETQYLIDMLRFLGLMNTTVVAAGIICLYRYFKSKNKTTTSGGGGDNGTEDRRWEYILLFTFATMSQFIGDIKIIKDGKTKPNFWYTITAGDGLLGFINLYVAIKLFQIAKKTHSYPSPV